MISKRVEYKADLKSLVMETLSLCLKDLDLEIIKHIYIFKTHWKRFPRSQSWQIQSPQPLVSLAITSKFNFFPVMEKKGQVSSHTLITELKIL